MKRADTLSTVLVVDDEVRSQEVMRRTLDEDFTVYTAGDAQEARERLERTDISVILCDQRMPGLTGVLFLKEVRERWPDTVRIVISGYTDSEDIIAGINEAGIYQYILKPWIPDHLLATVRNAVEAQTLQRDTNRLHLELRTSTPVLRQRATAKLTKARSIFDFDRIERAPGSPLDAVCEVAVRVARYDLSVLVLGESGTGKELLARAMHYASSRAGGAFVMENCAAIPDTLLESELFGHKRGAFTGAYEDHPGLFQRASGGTIFLDEIGETSPAFQVRLLRVLQEREVRPVGAAHSVPVDVRVIAATHRDLEQRVREGLFREDLYYRIAGVSITVPSLRERAGDIAPIARRLVQEVGAELGRPEATLSDESLACLMGYPWPGNIRELRNEIARAIALSDGAVIAAQSFSLRVLHGQAGLATARQAGAQGTALPRSGTLGERLDAIEAMVLRETLLRHRWNKTRAATELGLSRVGLRGKMARFGLEG
ncbi:MAG: sigma-54 dependent transcriptional regulator [Gammaproteobacteria bacterium]|uniref:sigma-54-dependent transcriptional regulator n=1 Tax=Rhodoferax sp. TaxID=50421 RepID=UPI0017E2397D|nr:sigma-54 dependent transcriptional regulator [Rhodoferax sp.]MBU3899450.1 sigma-54 dependent transcriptional regulator [Gammaproteobacteria bacterium]MBA3057250.1 sigma-54-dependent Fis family transcriptional regulator [Rhodoferax sp.]MBU3996354.1 sigma-54 dependent transcriptional regulator [Gammaproteobacteria bacterium]MBU4080705.1 sigma-54 dependent transcriptional regulator [Gammaproteobacteria bacterium]MBU4113505.1 sigma-54 dependent transcriptional regulator [Gammaproteobacteria bac